MLLYYFHPFQSLMLRNILIIHIIIVLDMLKIYYFIWKCIINWIGQLFRIIILLMISGINPLTYNYLKHSNILFSYNIHYQLLYIY